MGPSLYDVVPELYSAEHGKLGIWGEQVARDMEHRAEQQVPSTASLLLAHGGITLALVGLALEPDLGPWTLLFPGLGMASAFGVLIWSFFGSVRMRRAAAALRESGGTAD